MSFSCWLDKQLSVLRLQERGYRIEKGRGKSFPISQKEVLNAYKAVKAIKGAGGVDGADFEEFEKDWKNQLYTL